MTARAQLEWTILLYTMADDPSLHGCAIQTLKDIARALAPGGRVKAVAQITLRNNIRHAIRRYDFESAISPARHFEVATGLEYECCRDRGPRLNLADFLRWGQAAFPARRTCVVLQGHAWGADYDIPSLKLGHRRRGQPPLAHGQLVQHGIIKSGVVQSSTAHHGSGANTHYRLILGSPRSRRHLTNRDLQQVLTDAAVRDKFDLLGMDSCLMSMAEVLCELRGCAGFTVAPEGLGPVRGWPFYPILSRLGRQPAMEPAELGAAVLASYARRFRDWGHGVNLTIALCSLEFADELMQAVSTLTVELRRGLRSPATRKAIVRARLGCRYFRIPTYIDLVQFCRVLSRDASLAPDSPLSLAAVQVEAVVRERFVRQVALRRGDREAHGLSIYFPKWRIGARQRDSPWKRIAWTDPMATPVTYDEAVIKVNTAYLNHQFADCCGWKHFLLEFLQARLVA